MRTKRGRFHRMVHFLVGSIFVLSTGCTVVGQRFYDQKTGRWYYKPEGFALFNPFSKGQQPTLITGNE